MYYEIMIMTLYRRDFVKLDVTYNKFRQSPDINVRNNKHSLIVK